jgi:hypothetical protein
MTSPDNAQKRFIVYYPQSNADEIAAIAANPYYTNVILGQFHMNEQTGELTWNAMPLNQIPAATLAAVRSLSQGPHAKVVSIQLSAAVSGTWKYIAANPQNAVAILTQAMQGGYGFGGVDLDPEPVGTVSLQLLYNFTLLLGPAARRNGFALSHVPVPFDSNYFPTIYTGSYWAQMSAYVDWVTPQWYGSTGDQLFDVYVQFITATGMPPSLVEAGQQTLPSSSPADLASLERTIRRLNARFNGQFGGVGMWAYPLPTPAWSPIIAAALAGAAEKTATLPPGDVARTQVATP